MRHIARSRVNAALHTFATDIAALTRVLIHQLTPRQAARIAPEQLLATILRQPRVAQLSGTPERYTGDFPELSEYAERTRERLIRRAFAQLKDACEPYQQQRRWRFTRGLRSH